MGTSVRRTRLKQRVRRRRCVRRQRRKRRDHLRQVINHRHPRAETEHEREEQEPEVDGRQQRDRADAVSRRAVRRPRGGVHVVHLVSRVDQPPGAAEQDAALARRERREDAQARGREGGALAGGLKRERGHRDEDCGDGAERQAVGELGVGVAAAAERV
eukprot:31139-Pelagococcus_subviridis.AAC.4